MTKRLALTSDTTDDSLKAIAILHIQSRLAGHINDEWNAKRLYDRIVAIHKAREAIRRSNKRKRGVK